MSESIDMGLVSDTAPAPAPSAAPPAPAPKPSAASDRTRGHSPALEQREAVAARASGEAPAPAADPQQPAPPTGEKIKIGKYEVSEEDFGTMMERQAQEDLRKATVPPTPQDYKLAIPDGMKLPGDVDFRFDEAGNKAAFDSARAWAHGKGLSQSDFSEMLGLYASQEAQQHAALAERSRQEIAKVGINGPQRVDAVSKWITGMVGEADAKPIRATIVTDAHVRFYETIMTKLMSQGSAPFSQQHRAAPETRSIPNYESMSFEQRRFAQDELAARRGGR